MERLNETDPNDLVAENQGFFQKFFGKIKKSIYEMQAKYQEVGSQVDKIAIRLDHEKNGLLMIIYHWNNYINAIKISLML